MRLGANTRQYIGIALVALVTIVGAGWYWLLEGFGLVDAMYQSVITVSTVGFGETQELDTSGRIFTMGLIVVGAAAMVYTLAGFAEMVIESSIQQVSSRRKERTLDRLSGHTIVCGYGRTGAAVVDYLPAGAGLGIIELDAERADAAAEAGHIVLEGDCTLDETLLAAGIDRADRLIVCLASDSDAISTVLSAKVLDTPARIVTRVNDAASVRKLRHAGADQVVSPIEMGAQRLVADALEPSVGSFLDAALHDESVGLTIRGVMVQNVERFATIREIEDHTGVRVLGVRSGDGHIIDGPLEREAVLQGQTLIVVGSRDSLSNVEAALGAATTSAGPASSTSPTDRPSS